MDKNVGHVLCMNGIGEKTFSYPIHIIRFIWVFLNKGVGFVVMRVGVPKHNAKELVTIF